jgi:DNA repair exonuclease SbcCD nuclease subunit
MKLIVFNDPHFSARPPASRKSGYAAQILAKLAEIVDFGNANNVDVLVCTGDWFISKKPDANPYWLVAEIYRLLSDFDGQKITAIGNHDLETTMEFFAHSPLYALCKMSQMEYNCRSGFVFSDYGQGVEILTVNFDKGTREGIWEVSQQFTSQQTNPSLRKRILIVHAPIVHTTFSGQYPEQFMVSAVPAADLIGCCDYLFYGDIHDYHGVYTLGAYSPELDKNVQTTFCNLGSLARNSAHELNRYRTVLAAYFDTQTGLITPLELESAKPIEEVFRVEDILREKQNENDVSAFVDALDPNSLSFQILSPEVMRQRVQDEPDLSDREKAIALEAIETAS